MNGRMLQLLVDSAEEVVKKAALRSKWKRERKLENIKGIQTIMNVM